MGNSQQDSKDLADIGDVTLNIINSVLGGGFPKRPNRVIPANWITYRERIDKQREVNWVNRYDNTEMAKLPEHLKDAFVKTMIGEGYLVHDFSSNGFQPIEESAADEQETLNADRAETQEGQKVDKDATLKFDVYLIGYSTPKYEGEKLEELFKRLGGFNEGNRKTGKGVIDDRFSLAVQSVIGGGQICFGGDSHGDITDQIKNYCYRKNLTELKGNENPAVIERTKQLIRYIRILREQIDYYEKLGGKGTRTELDLTKMQDWIADDFLRLFHERSRNTHIPTIDEFLSSRQDDKRLIGIYSPDYFRKDTFMGGYKEGAFSEPTHYGGLKEVCARHNANYITFMRPSSELKQTGKK